MVVETSHTRNWHGIRRWYWTRNWRHFLAGIPAVLGLGTLVTLASMAFSVSSSDRQVRYQREGKAALDRDDLPRALCCFERLAPTAGERPEIAYQLALAADQAGQLGRAMGLMEKLAPRKGNGYGPAHLWWGRKWLEVERPNDRTRADAEFHLLAALKSKVEDTNLVHALLGQLYLRLGELAKAELHLLEAVKLRPALRLSLATVFARRKDTERARQEAKTAARLFSSRTQRNPNNRIARLGWADALTFLEDFPQAVRVLEDGLSTSKEEVFRLALGRVYLAWHDYRKIDKGADETELFSLIQKGLSNDPANADLLRRVLERTRASGQAGETQRKLLRRAVASGKATALGHLALSIDAEQRGKQEEARFFLGRAWDLDPRLGMAAINLALVLGESDKEELPQALRIINLSLAQAPNHSAGMTARGRIYLKLGKFEEALADFHYVIKQPGDHADTHLALADLYDKKGERDRAAEHRRLALMRSSPSAARP